MKVETTKELILEAASKCSTAKETLKTLFPEVFEEYFKLADDEQDTTVFDSEYVKIRIARGISPSTYLKNKCFWLMDNCNWELKTVNGDTFLIPKRKN